MNITQELFKLGTLIKNNPRNMILPEDLALITDDIVSMLPAFDNTFGPITKRDGQIKLERWLQNRENYENIEPDDTTAEDDTKLEYPFFIHGYSESFPGKETGTLSADVVKEYLKPYKEQLCNIGYLPDSIMSDLENELKNFYSQNQEDGLKEFLDQKFGELVQKYYNIYKYDLDAVDFVANTLEGMTFESEAEFMDFCGEYYVDLKVEVTGEDNEYINYNVSYTQAKGPSAAISVKKEGTVEEENNIETDAKKREIKNYLQEVKSKLVSSNNYSEDYANTIIKFLEQKVDYDAEDFSITDAKNKLNDIVANLTGKTNLQGYDYNHEQHTYKMVSLFTDEYTSMSVQNEFFAFMINNAVDFKNEDDRLVFLQRVFKNAAEKIGMWTQAYMNYNTLRENDTHMRVSDLYKLDENGDEAWFNEFYEIIKSEADKLNKTSNYVNATKIDSSSLFGDGDVIKAEDISQRLDDMLFCEDDGVVKLRSMLYKSFERFNVDNYYDETEIITNIIKMLNEKAGVENTKPIKLTKEAFEKLNDGTIFELLEELINSDELRKEYYFGIDDELDLYGEGSLSGACWAIAGLTSLSSSELGKQMIKEAMTFNDDGSVTVTFKGALDEDGNPRSYTITREEMESAKNNNDGVSYGDNTMFVLLLATEKLRNDLDISYGTLQSALSPDDPGYGIWLGSQSKMINWLTGKSGLLCSNEILYEVIDNLYSNIEDKQLKAYIDYIAKSTGQGRPTVLIENLLIEHGYCDNDDFRAYSEKEKFDLLKDGLLSGDVIMSINSGCYDINIPLVPEGTLNVSRSTNHAWGVKEITEETVTFWDLYRQTEYTVKIEDLINSKFLLSYTILNDDYNFQSDFRLKQQNLDVDIYDLIDFDSSNIQRDKSTFSDAIVPRTKKNINEILNSSNNPISSWQFRGSNPKRLSLLMSYEIENLIKSIYANMPNYTDFISLEYAYKETNDYFEDMINELCCEESKNVEFIQLLDSGLNTAQAFENIFGINIDINTIFEKFLSYLPNDSDVNNGTGEDTTNEGKNDLNLLF